MKEFNYAPPQSAAETDPNAALQAQLDQATTKIAELKAEMEKYGEELFHTTQTVLDAIRECPAYTLLYQFFPKDTGKSKVK